MVKLLPGPPEISAAYLEETVSVAVCPTERSLREGAVRTPLASRGGREARPDLPGGLCRPESSRRALRRERIVSTYRRAAKSQTGVPTGTPGRLR